MPPVASVDLATEFLGLRLRNPVFVASGTFGYGEEFAKHFDLAKLGAVIVKSLTPAPRPGNAPHRIHETAAGMLNSIGLQNVGVDAFIREKWPWLRTQDVPVFANVAGSTMEEYEQVCAKLKSLEGLAGVELNISCPNVKAGGMEFGVNPKLAEEVTAKAKKAFGGRMIVKLSPNVTSIAEIAKAVEAGGADAVSVVNTFLGMAVDLKGRKPVLTTTFGGLSGPAIKPLALRCVWQVAGAVKIPILGLGGITTGEDAAEFLAAGATAIAVGTANFLEPKASVNVIDGLAEVMRREGFRTVAEATGSARRTVQ